jgi:putative transposase
VQTQTQEHAAEPAPSTPRRGGGTPLGTALSRASLERWLSDYTESGYDIRSLAPELALRARKGEVRRDSESETIVTAVLAECEANPMKRSVNDVYLMVVNRIAQENRTRPDGDKLAAPSVMTIHRRIIASKANILNRRKGRLETQADAPVEDGPNPTRILERVEIDNTLLDLFIVDEEDRLLIGRPTLTYALDVYSGFPCGVYVGFEPASYRTAAACLYHSIMPKGDVRGQFNTANDWPVYGQMETLVVDNGKDFTGADLTDACGQLGIILEVLPVKTPWFKGSVERFFRTNNTGLIHGLHGTTFSNVLERGEYDAMQHACISLTGFWKLLHIFLLDIYAQKYHEGKQAIPYKRWQTNLEMGFAPVLHTSAEETRIMLMRSETRTIQRSGIQFEWLFYRNPDLMRLRSQLPEGTEVRVKFDPGDISAIYVTDPTTGKRLHVPVAREALAYAQGLSLWKHRIINRYVQAQRGDVDIEALAAAKAKIQQIVASEYAVTRTSRGRKTAARFLGVAVPEPLALAPSLALPAPTPALPAPETQPEPESQPEPAAPAAPAKPARKPRQAKPAAPSPAAPTDDLDDLDLSGWGGDYQLPPSSGDTQ